jgi:subtilisin family serine protease
VTVPRPTARRGLVPLLAVVCLCLTFAAPPLAAAAGLDGPKGPSASLVRPPTLAPGQIVVKLWPGGDIDEVNRRLGSTTVSILLASRSIFLIQIQFPAQSPDHPGDWKGQVDQAVQALRHDPGVRYAEPNSAADAPEGERFHLWPYGHTQCVTADPAVYSGQPAAQLQELAEVHARATGAGSVVAVLDTGVDLDHPTLAGRIAPGGYDYVDDDPVPDDTASGTDLDHDGMASEAYGHGTFVSGIVELVAPGARILPERVLDPDGNGNTFVVAEAIFDAVARGVDAINMSFGTAEKLDSKVLKDALGTASKAGVVLVGAAGNDASSAQHYPAALPGVVSVAALSPDDTDLAAFSAHGPWVDLAAPGVDIVSTLPCGFGRWSGTSMAAGFVSGEAALLSQVLHRHKLGEVLKHLMKGTVKLHGVDVHGGSIDIRRTVYGH